MHRFFRNAPPLIALLAMPLTLGGCMADLAGSSTTQDLSAPAGEIQPRLITASPAIYSKPRGLALSASGQYLFVADQGNSAVQVLDAFSLNKVGSIGEDRLIDPFAVHVDSRGTLYVADTGNNRVLSFTINGTNGRFKSEFIQRLQQPEGIVVTRTGKMIITNGGSDSLTIYQNGQVDEQMTAQARMNFRLGQPKDVVVNRLGNLLISDTRNRRILMTDDNLTLLRTIEGAMFGFREPFDLAIGGDGWLYVADALNNQIQVYDELLQQRGTIGTGAQGAGSGQLSRPEGVAVRGKTIYISDTDNNRILRYERD